MMMKDELYAAPEDEWQNVPFTANRHLWWLRWYRFGDEGEFRFTFESPMARRYTFFTGSENGHVRVTDAHIVLANGEMLASYYAVWGGPDELNDVLRLVPKHILDRLFMLLDAIG